MQPSVSDVDFCAGAVSDFAGVEIAMRVGARVGCRARTATVEAPGLAQPVVDYDLLVVCLAVIEEI